MILDDEDAKFTSGHSQERYEAICRGNAMTDCA
jgi:hypothetical protein